MGTRLVLVRHAQASALGADYDRLSALGREQSRHLGAWLARWARAPAHVLVGPRQRHRQTYEEARAAAAAAGASWPAPELPYDGLDEHHGLQLVTAIGAGFVARTDEIGELARAAFAGGADAMRSWMRLVRAVLLAYARGELGHEGVETWAAFRERLARTLEDVRGREGTVIAFTSGGAIGVIVGQALGLDEPRTLDLCWAVRNASVTELQLGRRGPRLVGFNATPPFDRDELVTLV